jgi:drug/metabolite transporter (DMT)-like permease
VRQTTRSAWLQIHLCVVLWGFTAILGKLIRLPALPLVWWRMLLVSLALWLMPSFWRGLRQISAARIWIYAGIGVLVLLHWLTFYGAIKLANASVAATCMALPSVFVAWLEPRLDRRPLDRGQLLLGIATVPGVALVVGGTPAGLRLGLLLGIASALLAALFGTLNKRHTGESHVLSVTGIEMGSGLLVLSLIAPLLPPSLDVFALPDGRDFGLLAVLALLCTLLPFALFLRALRHISAFGAALATNLEPVYAIALAGVLFGEQRQLGPSFYVGVAIILLAVCVQPALERRRRVVPL